MNKRFRFTTSAIAALPANPLDAAGTELECKRNTNHTLQCGV